MARQARGGGVYKHAPPPFTPRRQGPGPGTFFLLSLDPIDLGISSLVTPQPCVLRYPPRRPAGRGVNIATAPTYLPTGLVCLPVLGRYKILIRSLADTSLAPIDGWTHHRAPPPRPVILVAPVPVAHVVPSPILQVAAPPVSGFVFPSVFLFSCASSGEKSVCGVVGSG